MLELNVDVIGEWVAKPKRGTLLLIIAMATAAVGHYNHSQNRDDSGK